MTRNLAIPAIAAFAFALTACGSNKDDALIEDDAYNADAPSLEEVSTNAEMEALEQQEENLQEEAAKPTPAAPAVTTDDVTGDNADTEDVVGL